MPCWTHVCLRPHTTLRQTQYLKPLRGLFSKKECTLLLPVDLAWEALLPFDSCSWSWYVGTNSIKDDAALRKRIMAVGRVCCCIVVCVCVCVMCGVSLLCSKGWSKVGVVEAYSATCALLVNRPAPSKGATHIDGAWLIWGDALPPALWHHSHVRPLGALRFLLQYHIYTGYADTVKNMMGYSVSSVPLAGGLLVVGTASVPPEACTPVPPTPDLPRSTQLRPRHAMHGCVIQAGPLLTPPAASLGPQAFTELRAGTWYDKRPDGSVIKRTQEPAYLE